MTDLPRWLDPDAGIAVDMARDPVAPDQAAEHLRIATENGVPRELVQEDPEPFQRMSRQNEIAREMRGLSELPKWLEEPDNAALAGDDLSTLSNLERTGRFWADRGRRVAEGATSSVTSTFKATDLLRQGIAEGSVKGAEGRIADLQKRRTALVQARDEEAAAGTDISGYEDEIAQIDLELETAAFQKGMAEVVANTPVEEMPDYAFGERVDQAVEDTVGAPDPSQNEDFTAQLASGAGQVLGMIGTSLVPVVGPLLGTASGSSMAAVGQYEDAIASGADEETALTAAGLGGLVGLTEIIPLMRAMRPLERYVPGLRGRFVATVTKVAKSAGEEAAQEALQTTLENLIAADLYDPERGAFDNVGTAAAIGAILGGGVSLAGSARKPVVQDAARASEAGTTATALQEVDEIIAGSNLKDRAPERLRDFIERTGLNDATLRVNAEDLNTFFQNEVPADALKIGAEVFEEALASGGTVEIPASVYASSISGTDMASWFHENATLDDGEMSVSEAQRFNESWNEAAQEAWEEAQAEANADLEARAGDVQVRDAVFSQLRAAGRSPDVADRESQVWGAFFRTMGERYGEDPLDLARQFGVRIEGPQTPEQRVRDNLDISLNTLRAKGVPKGRSRQTLRDFIIADGGISDLDNEFSDLPDGFYAAKPEDNLLGPSGDPQLTDEVARRAREAGFFPDVDDNADMREVLLDALDKEISGAAPALHVDDLADNSREQSLINLAEELDRRGLDIGTLSNDEIVAALMQEGQDGETFFQDKSAPRGQITFPAGGIENGETVISLFESADLSTLLHESGHFFLEGFRTLAERGDAPEGMAADLKAINAFLGHKDGAYSVDAQEKWARGFEAYLMEGKAPSLELADAFSRFKAWLTRIYKSIAGLNVKLTPEIREVMDRMLATDQEIAGAREEQGMKPLFSDASVAGMSDAEFRPYQRMAQRSAEQASQKLLKKTMDKVRREKAAWFKEEKKAVLAEVIASTDRRSEYRLIEALANQKVLGSDDAFEGMQIDRKELKARFGDGVLAEISRTRLGGKRAIYADGGESPDVVAEIFGFESADAMVRVLQNTVKRKDYIAQEVDRIMSERHGDPLADGSIEEEALAAIHTEQQAQTVATEARQLAKRIGKDHRNINAKIFRQRAKGMIGRMQVRQAAKPAGFLMAERQAARSAQKAFSDIAAGRGDPEERIAAAQRFKEQQLINQYLYMEARDLEAEVKRGREKMRAYDKPKVREKLAGDYIEQIDGILQDYEFRVTSQKQIERDSSLAEYVDRMIEEGREAELAIDQRLIDNARKTHYSRLSVDELRGLLDTVANIDHMGRRKQKLIDGQRKRDLDESVGRVVDQIQSTAGGGRADRNQGIAAKARSALNLLWSVDTIAMEYDNWQEFGAFYDEVKSGIDKASAEEQRMSVELAGKMESLFSVYSAKELSRMQDKKSIDGANGRSWSKMEIIAAALNTGNEDNLQRLLSPDAYEQSRLDSEQLDALLETLDKRDWDFVQSLWDLIDSYWPQLSEVEQRRTGVKPQKVEARPVYTKFGMLRGGYYPISYDPSVPGATVRDQESAFDRFVSAGRGSRAAVKNGMTKAREKTGGGRTLKFDLQVPFAHLRDTIRLITLSETVDATHRILNDNRVRDALLDAGRADDRKLLNLWLKDVAEGPIFNSDFVNATTRTIKNNFTLSKLAFNLKTIALQLTGLGQAAATIGKKNMLSGLVTYGKDMPGTVSDVMARSAFMSERQTTFQKDLYDFANDVKISSPIASRYSKGIDFVSKMGFWPIQKLQFYAVDMPTWLGAYQAELSKGTPEGTAVQRADRLVARSQASGMMGDRAAVERGTLSESTRQSDMVKIWTTLGSYMLAKMNRGRIEGERIVRDVSDGDLTAGEKVVSVLDGTANLLLLYVFEAAVMGLAYSMATDDEDDDAFAKYVMAETTSSLVAGVPFVRDVAGGLKGFDTGGVMGSVFGVAGDVVLQVSQGENDKGFRRAMGDAIGTSTGLPTTQSLRVIEGILDDDTPLFEAMFGRNPLEN